MILGRTAERAAIDRALAAVRTGESRAISLRGDPGVGKSALLDCVAARADGCRVIRAVGIESEMELAFVGLQQLCEPLLEIRHRLPGPQREALESAFGLGGATAPDRFFVGLAVLNLLAEAASQQPLVCIVDDVQWLDKGSGQALAFVARRLSMESVALFLAARGTREDLDLGTSEELVLQGLSEQDSRSLLASVVPWVLDTRMLDRIVAETRGNPLALLELPRAFGPAELAGGYGLGDPTALTGRIEDSFARRFDSLPAASQRLLLLAAAEPLGDAVIIRRAAAALAIPLDLARPAAVDELCEFGARVRFRHPLVRSAVYRAASVEDRRTVHHALAEVTDGSVDPDRRAWHRARAAAGFDEDVAAELERSADRAQARGGVGRPRPSWNVPLISPPTP